MEPTDGSATGPRKAKVDAAARFRRNIRDTVESALSGNRASPQVRAQAAAIDEPAEALLAAPFAETMQSMVQGFTEALETQTRHHQIQLARCTKTRRTGG